MEKKTLAYVENGPVAGTEVLKPVETQRLPPRTLFVAFAADRGQPYPWCRVGW